MFVDDYRQFEIDGAEEVSRRCVLFEDFISVLLEAEPKALPLGTLDGRAAIHGHCHAKALADPAVAERLLRQVPGLEVQPLETGCCGMAGAFGMMKTNRNLSLAVADPLVRQITPLSGDTLVVAAGTSCRHQIRDLTGRECLHPAEVLAAALIGH
jgi:Fe-S oxidoreductase